MVVCAPMLRGVSSDKLIIFGYFLAVIAAGAALLSIPAAWGGPDRLGFLDALFTSTSAVCVTGLIVVDTAEFTRFGQIVIMALIQFGGLGIVTFATLFVAIPRRRLSLLNRGLIQEFYLGEVEVNPRRIVAAIVGTTVLFELLGFLALRSSFGSAGVDHPMFSAAFIAVSAFCNAGFAVFSDSLNGFVNSWSVNLTVMLLIVTGGLGFVVIQDLYSVLMRRKRRLSYHSRVVLRTTLILVCAGALAFLALEWTGALSKLPVGSKIMAALFQSVTTRTAGFDTVPQASFGLPSVALVLLLMFTGGSPGSTAGGVKTTTMFLAFHTAFGGTESDGSLTLRGGAVSSGSVARALSLLVKAAAIVALSFLGLLIFDGTSAGFQDLFFEAVSAFGTVGLSRGITSALSDPGKLVLIMTMFAGRVGLFAMAAFRRPDRIERWADYPREDLMLG